jgi:hypothetical protein
LFESGNLEACTQAVREACAHPLFGRGQVDSQTLERMRTYLSAGTMVRRFEEVYQKVFSQSANRTV